MVASDWSGLRSSDWTMFWVTGGREGDIKIVDKYATSIVNKNYIIQLVGVTLICWMDWIDAPNDTKTHVAFTMSNTILQRILIILNVWSIRLLFLNQFSLLGLKATYTKFPK